MSTTLKYMPIFRSREWENKVLEYFDFGDRIYPCVEIIKEVDRLPAKPKKKSKKAIAVKNPKLFETVYGPLLKKIRAEYVFIDLPIHLSNRTKLKPNVLDFFTRVISRMEVRTEYIKKLIPWAGENVIPVISSYYDITGVPETIVWQENELRAAHFKTIAFRTFLNTFEQDIKQIKPVLQSHDYLIVDWGDEKLDLSDPTQMEIIGHLSKLNCTIITHRNPIANDVTNVGLEHGQIVDKIDNSLLDKYKTYGGVCFSDYAGIKKDNLDKGAPLTSPGFVYYDAVINEFYGFRFEHGGHKKGEQRPNIDEFVTRIVPDIIKSEASQRMLAHTLPFLGSANLGWRIIKNIKAQKEKGRSAAKFKRIGMEHYLHCIKTRIKNGDFD